MLHEHAAALSAASPANRSRRLIKCAKESARYHRMKKLILNLEKISQYNAEHRAILEVLLHRDAGSAVSLITAHLANARLDLIGADEL
jgi:DNA-binding GntR family transcriptional regulator